MAWVRPLVLILLSLWALLVLFSRDGSGRREVSNLFNLSVSDLGSIVRASTPAGALWLLTGVGLVLWLHVSAWHLLWWVSLGYIGIVATGKLLMRRAG